MRKKVWINQGDIILLSLLEGQLATLVVVLLGTSSAVLATLLNKPLLAILIPTILGTVGPSNADS